MPSLTPSDSPVDSESARHYLVGPDAAGHWLAVETHGFGGGIFVTMNAAVHYARSETGRRHGAVDLVERLVGFTN